VARNDILEAAIAVLDERGGRGLTMRALAARLGVTPMSLYRHVTDHAGLLVAISDRVYGEVLEATRREADPRTEISALLNRYHAAVGRHPQLTMAIFAETEAFAGVTRQITDRLGSLLEAITQAPLLWRDILVDHAHGSALALSAARSDQVQAGLLREQYRQALDCLLQRIVGS
jgi:AcrR family transcriptional regulator